MALRMMSKLETVECKTGPQGLEMPPVLGKVILNYPSKPFPVSVSTMAHPEARWTEQHVWRTGSLSKLYQVQWQAQVVLQKGKIAS